MLYPTALNAYNVWKSKKEIENYMVEIVYGETDYSEQWAAVEDYNRRLAEKQNQMLLTAEEKEEYRTLLDLKGTGMMGYIEIPRINVRLPIYHGTEEAVLQVGSGHWEGTSLPAGGESTHCILTAHTGLVKAKMFTDVDQLTEGDTFSLTILDRVLTYEVDQSLVVTPEDNSELLTEEGKDLVTLYTCYPYGVNTHRLLVRGHRIPTPEAEKKIADMLNLDSGKWYVIGILVIFLLLLTVLLLMKKKKKRRKLKAERAAQGLAQKEAETSKEAAGLQESEKVKEASDQKGSEKAKEAAGQKEPEKAKEAADQKESEKAKETADQKGSEKAKETADQKETKKATDQKETEAIKRATDQKVTEESERPNKPENPEAGPGNPGKKEGDG